MFGEWINHVRESMGAAPRRFAESEYAYLAPPIPWWVRQVRSEPLMQQYHSHPLLFGQGFIDWAALVQANNDLFEPGTDNAMPALALFSPDPHFEEDPLALRMIAEELYDLREKRQRDPELRVFARQLNNERTRYGRRAVPERLSEGRQVFLVDVMVHREHLPDGVLRGIVFPILHHPQTWNVWIVPARYWPAKFVEEWDEI